MAISASETPSRSAARRTNGRACNGLTQLRSVVGDRGSPAKVTGSPAASTDRDVAPDPGFDDIPSPNGREYRGRKLAQGVLVHAPTLTGRSSFWYGRPRSSRDEGRQPRVPTGVTAVARGAAISTHVHRFVRHIWVLGVAAILVVLVARPTAVPAAPLLRNLAAIQINAVVENSSSVTAVALKPAQTVVVQPGQTIATLATQYHASTSAIQWGNQLTPTDRSEARDCAAHPARTRGTRPSTPR